MCLFCALSPGSLSRRTILRAAPAACLLPAGVAADDLVEPATRLKVPDGAPRTVALTLDACSGGTDMRILATLLDLSVPATLFVTGLWLRANAEALRWLRARPDLFTLQNHGERHLPPVLGARQVYGLPVAGTIEAVRREVTLGADAIAAACGTRPTWYRGATGRYSPSALAAIEAMGWRIAGYTLSADAGASLPATSVARRMAAARQGDVILAHVNHPARPAGAGVAAGVAALRAAGVAFVGLDALPVATA